MAPPKLVRVGLWSAIAAFAASALAGGMEDVLGWSDDPRWIAYGAGWLLAAASLVGGVAARLAAPTDSARSRFPTLLLVATVVVGVLVLVAHVLAHLGPMGVV